MKNRILEYPLLTVYDITLEPFEVRKFPAEPAGFCFGSIYVYGCIVPQGEESGPPILNHREYRPRDVWGVKPLWDDPKASAVFQASDVGARWLCVARETPLPITPVAVDGSYVVPPGYGVLICWTQDATVLIDDQQAVTADFVMPREKEILVTGTCDLLLVGAA